MQGDHIHARLEIVKVVHFKNALTIRFSPLFDSYMCILLGISLDGVVQHYAYTGKRRLGNVLAWLDRVRARPGVAAGVKWGMQDEAEVDKWSQETRAKYMAMGGKIATAHGKSKL